MGGEGHWAERLVSGGRVRPPLDQPCRTGVCDLPNSERGWISDFAAGEFCIEGVNTGGTPADVSNVNTQTPTVAGDVERVEATGTERRRSERHGYIIEAWLGSASAGQEREEVATLNLSKHGVAFQLMRPVEVGTFHVLEISMGVQKLVSRVVIRRCQPVDNQFWDVGAEFC